MHRTKARSAPVDVSASDGRRSGLDWMDTSWKCKHVGRADAIRLPQNLWYGLGGRIEGHSRASSSAGVMFDDRPAGIEGVWDC